jgi:Notch-like protein
LPTGGYTCSCAPGWTGTNCATSLNSQTCTMSCMNSGTCTIINGAQQCICPNGYGGTYCQIRNKNFFYFKKKKLFSIFL